MYASCVSFSAHKLSFFFDINKSVSNTRFFFIFLENLNLIWTINQIEIIHFDMSICRFYSLSSRDYLRMINLVRENKKKDQLVDKEKNFENICWIGYLLLLLLLSIPYDHLVEG